MVKKLGSKTPIDIAVSFLSYRPRSEAEIRGRLLKFFPSPEVEETIAILHDKGLLNDKAFATFWRDNREQHRPRSRFMLLQELLHKGINRDLADTALVGLDEEANALRAGRKLLRRLRTATFNVFQIKTINYLRRRGFSYRLAAQTSEVLWKELTDPTNCYIDRKAQHQYAKQIAE